LGYTEKVVWIHDYQNLENEDIPWKYNGNIPRFAQ
jgi:hypothetical protein